MDFKLSKRRQVFEFLSDFQSQFGYPPTVREIASAVGLASPASVQAHLRSLERDGLIERDPNKPRALKLNHPAEARLSSESNSAFPGSVSIPILGRVAAGTGVLAFEDQEGELLLSRETIGQGDHFALKVRGDSMVEMGIFENDWVVARVQKIAQVGEVVICGIFGDEATVKILSKLGEEVELLPANKNYQPIRANHEDVSIFGKVVALVRSFA
ncbi:MAG: transcriptional repressor LexA [Acidimicrobiaceae bacterium]|nr:transcriptional repressor LexA [Acidimicrobiaceae bacterium]